MPSQSKSQKIIIKILGLFHHQIQEIGLYGRRSDTTLDELLILNALQVERRITTPEAGHLIQKGANAAKANLECLIERGLVQGIGEKRGRHYMLSPQIYKQLNASSQYFRAKGFEGIQQGQFC